MHDDRSAHEPERPRAGAPGENRRPSALSQGNGRSGDDVRRRGWFWHWNGIITQYTPLIGLKGVGLLNSYTAWTDRREHSPHRGYAFPSQRAEAAFYGEDRAELITINKILVALDLIEIRKEMVAKTDEQGRNWRVPHNFYRVKDRVEGLDLTTDDVLRVVELADRDAAVYRYIRKIFSSKFQPIDRDNVWHRILEEVAEHPTWRKLQAKARKQEERASARTRAGHKARKAAQPSAPDDAPTSADAETTSPVERNPALLTTGHISVDVFEEGERNEVEEAPERTSVAASNQASAASDDKTNRGWTSTVDLPNHGWNREGGTIAEPDNTALASTVEPSNPTNNQEITTTTTTTTREAEQQFSSEDIVETSDQSIAGGTRSTTGQGTGSAGSRTDRSGDASAGSRPDTADGWGPLDDPSTLVVSLFEAANDRRATPLERVLLSELERDASRAAARVGSTGAEWVAAALREAVESGSAFVAPRRIREIINRWTADGDGPRVDEPELAHPPTGSGRSSPEELWHQIWQVLQQRLGESATRPVIASSEVIDLRGRRLVVAVTDPEVLWQLDGDYRSLVERTLVQVAGRPLDVEFIAQNDVPGSRQARPTSSHSVREISAGDAARGAQLWRAVLDDVQRVIPERDRERLSGALPLGQDPDGALVFGVNNRLAQELIESRHHEAIRSALSRLFGEPIAVRVCGPGRWRIRDQ